METIVYIFGKVGDFIKYVYEVCPICGIIALIIFLGIISRIGRKLR